VRFSSHTSVGKTSMCNSIDSTRAVRLTNELERDIAGFFWKGQ
jgi:hypothetical protein